MNRPNMAKTLYCMDEKIRFQVIKKGPLFPNVNFFVISEAFQHSYTLIAFVHKSTPHLIIVVLISYEKNKTGYIPLITDRLID